MSIKRILVHVEDSESSRVKLETAIGMAKHFNAVVSAVYIKTLGEQSLVSALANPPGMIAPAITEELKKNDDVAVESLNNVSHMVGQTERLYHFEIEFLTYTGDTKHLLAEKSHCYDLLIVNSELESDFGVGQISSPSNTLATKAGCPILVLPGDSNSVCQFEKPLIAWNGTPESARAISDSMPILEKAKRVSVVNMQKRHANFTSRDELNEELMRYLKLHKIDARLLNKKNGAAIKESEDINKVINKNNSDLLVLGAYGYSQLRELFFHSQTKELLNIAKVPVLLSK
ncbi:universal stress protein [Aliikangiella sp. G2MR2-5]|uniref:universal stress protein n=1 Tax=Aliikangiella sp. G2MR2-5 TaxID=2788943 RepID=UPI0018AAD790|nr:universal stress protein [Aliikangiella sp. G2MR2-5]